VTAVTPSCYAVSDALRSHVVYSNVSFAVPVEDAAGACTSLAVYNAAGSSSAVASVSVSAAGSGPSGFSATDFGGAFTAFFFILMSLYIVAWGARVILDLVRK